MLENAQTLSPGKKRLLEFILEQLSEADYVSSVLLRDFTDNGNKKASLSKSEDKMEIDAQDGEKMDIEVIEMICSSYRAEGESWKTTSECTCGLCVQ